MTRSTPSAVPLDAPETEGAGDGGMPAGDPTPNGAPRSTAAEVSLRLRKEEIWASLSQGQRTQNRLGRFRVLGRLGAGGMGVVFEAYDDTLERRVALKLLHATDDELQRARLLREAKALAQLSDPHVVQVYDVVEVDEQLFIAMELVSGITLAQWQAEGRSWRECVDVYRQAARGLVAAHARGLVHRDFKPANCIVDETGQVKVLDFGLVRGLEDGSSSEVMLRNDLTTGAISESGGSLTLSLTQTGATMGTVAYMAPEQLGGQSVRPPCDQFSLCVALYEALYGYRPFQGTSRASLLIAIEQGRWASPPPGVAPRRVPRWLRRVLLRGLSLDPADRYPSMSALLAALEPPRRVWPWAVGAGALGSLLLVSMPAAAPEPCAGLREAGVPGFAEADAEAVEAAVRGALPEPTSASGPVIGEKLRDWAGRWSEARAQACEQTRVHQVADAQLLERRNACLDQQQLRLTAIAGVLATADRSVAAHAVGAVHSLPPPERCLDAGWQQREPSVLPDSLHDAAVEVRQLLARSWASDATGRVGSGLELAERAVERARGLGPEAEPLQAEARFERGRLLRAVRRLQEARADLEFALRRAERTDDQNLAIDALRELMGVAANDDDPSAVAAWRASLTGKLERFVDDPRLEAEIAYLEGLGALDEDPGRAEAALRKAAMAYAVLGPQSVIERLHAQIRLAWAIDRQGRDEEALSTHQQSLALAQREGLVLMEALIHEELSGFHLDHGDLEAAQRHIQAAIDRRTPSFGLHAPVNTEALYTLADLQLRQGRIDEAAATAEDLRLSLDEAASPATRVRLHWLVASIHRLRDDWDGALAAYREVRRGLRSMRVPDEIELAMLESNIADCLRMKGDLDEAEAGYARALAVVQVRTEPNDRRRVFPLMGQAQVLVARRQLDASIGPYRQAWEIQREVNDDPEQTALLLWTMGRALVDAPGSGPRARAEGLTLVKQAEDAFVQHKAAALLEQVERWREDCGERCADAAR